MRIHLEFGRETSSTRRARLTYAFRLFCSVYGHDPVWEPEESGSAEVSIRYAGEQTSLPAQPCLYLSAAYTPRPPARPAPPPVAFLRHGVKTFLIHAPLPGLEPDWLGEIFEWVSCADEYSVASRDSAGRIPFSASYAGRHGLDSRIPYAAVAMRFLERELSRIAGRPAGAPASPTGSAPHFVVVTHDVDYWPRGRWNAAWRLAKNAGITVLEKRVRAGLAQAAMALKAAVLGRDPLDQIIELALRERRCGMGASYYLLPRHAHRRDANYASSQADSLSMMQVLEGSGFEVGVHTTYTSLDEPQGVEQEYDAVRRLGFQPLGGRQHWLRFTLDRLIPALERAGAAYDASLGWSDRIGFRAGACFAFPPYFFGEERPARFLELPMAIMDQGLAREARDGLRDFFSPAEHLLETSRQYGWGGISVLWHPAAFGAGWLPEEMGETFWHLAERGEDQRDRWVSGEAFLDAAWQRYVEVGLLPAQRGRAVAGEVDQAQDADARRAFAGFLRAPVFATPSRPPAGSSLRKRNA